MADKFGVVKLSDSVHSSLPVKIFGNLRGRSLLRGDSKIWPVILLAL